MKNNTKTMNEEEIKQLVYSKLEVPPTAEVNITGEDMNTVIQNVIDISVENNEPKL